MIYYRLKNILNYFHNSFKLPFTSLRFCLQKLRCCWFTTLFAVFYPSSLACFTVWVINLFYINIPHTTWLAIEKYLRDLFIFGFSFITFIFLTWLTINRKILLESESFSHRIIFITTITFSIIKSIT